MFTTPLNSIQHSPASVDLVYLLDRYLSVDLPHVREDMSRVVWCPRAPREIDAGQRAARLGPPHSADEAITYSIHSKLPVWNDDAGSLVLKFIGRRVSEASSKNILLVSKVESSASEGEIHIVYIGCQRLARSGLSC